ncbi:MAG: hypothetical protein KGL75_13975 [Acidobacteriota bacterium]|nr:hypothetical protein [Acidobacteriota bacterium]
MKSRVTASTHKKVAVFLLDGACEPGHINPAALDSVEKIDLLTPGGEHRSIPLNEVKAVCFVREFTGPFEPERKSFLSRPKLDGLWIRLRFRDNDEMEGVAANDLLAMLGLGVQLTPPDLHGNVVRMFIPRSALVQMKVLGVVGVARRPQPKPSGGRSADQPELFDE